jgi:PAS domain S-box-containing protein
MKIHMHDNYSKLISPYKFSIITLILIFLISGLACISAQEPQEEKKDQNNSKNISTPVLTASFPGKRNNNKQPLTVKIGFYENRPKIFTDSSSIKQGLFIDIIKYIAKQENWKLQFVPCLWYQSFDALLKGDIDLMPDVAISPQRSAILDFHKEYVIESWSQVYANKNSGIHFMSDLDNKKIAILKDSIQAESLKQLVSGLGYNTEFIDTPSYNQAFESTSKGICHAVVANHLFGNFNYQSYGLNKTPIVFKPAALYFAAAKNKNQNLLNAIDKHLLYLKNKNSSLYYESLNKWMDRPPKVIADKNSYFMLILSSFFLAGAVLLIRFLVRKIQFKNINLKSAAQSLSQSEDALRKINSELEILINTIPDALIYTDIDRKIIRVNPAFETIFQYSFDQVKGSSTIGLYAQEADYYKQGELHFSKNINLLDPEQQKKIKKPYKVNYKRKDNTVFLGESIGMPITDSNNNIIGMLGMVRDVTEKITLEKQLQHAQKLESIGRLASGVSHDFNNLLSVILSYADLLMPYFDKNTDQYEQMSQILEAGLRAKDLTGQLLAFSRKQIFQLKKIDLNEIIYNFKGLLTTLIGDNVSLNVNLGKEPLFIQADKGQIEQIIMNLGVNAKDAMPGGGTFSITVKPNLKKNSAVLILSDTGEGIPSENIKTIFEPFYTTKKEDKGTGLGLSTVHGIIQQHNGTIDVKSSQKRGTEFIITFPLCNGPDPSETIEIPEIQTLSGKETILLVEDNDLVKRLAARLLISLGYKVHSAETGKEAIELMNKKSETIDLLLTDMVMPGLSGAQLYEQALQIIPDLKVIFMSGYTDDSILKEIRKKENVQFISKPFDQQSLSRAIRKSLDIHI